MSRMRTRYRVTLVSAGLLLSAVIILWMRGGCGWQSIVPPSDSGLVGLTERAVRSRLGKPHLEFDGHYGVPSRAFADQFSGPIKTLVFRTVTGDEYVSFERRRDTWIVICNACVPAGAAF